MKDADKDLVFKAGLAVAAYFVIVKPVLNELGANDEDKGLVSDIDNMAPSENPFSNQYAPFVQEWGETINNEHNTEAQYWAYFEDKYPEISDSEVLRIMTAMHTIWDAFSIWHNANVQDVEYAISSLHTKTEVAAVASAMANIEGTDLWSYLKSGTRILPFWRNGLTDTELAFLVKKVNALPDDEV